MVQTAAKLRIIRDRIVNPFPLSSSLEVINIAPNTQNPNPIFHSKPWYWPNLPVPPPLRYCDRKVLKCLAQVILASKYGDGSSPFNLNQTNSSEKVYRHPSWMISVLAANLATMIGIDICCP